MSTRSLPLEHEATNQLGVIIGSAVNDLRQLYDPVHKRAAREWQALVSP
jgi:hypothetical protein